MELLIYSHNEIADFFGEKKLHGSLSVELNLGPEKVTNGSFTGAATGWTLTGGWTYGSDAVAKDGDGTTTLSQDVSAVANEIYKITYTVSGWSVGTVTVAVGGVSGTARGANGTYTEYIVATGTGSLTFTPTNTARFTIDTVSVKRVAVAAADRVTMWPGDRIASGVEAAGDAGLFIRSEDGTLSFIGDRWAIGSQDFYGRNSQKLEVNQSADEGGAALNTWSATAAEAAMFDFNRSKSATIGTHTVVVSADALGFITFRGSDGVGFIEAAQIRAEVDGTPGTNDMPGRLVFYTTADGAASVTERMRIDSSGRLRLVNCTIFPSADGVNAIQFTKADGTSPVITADTTTAGGPFVTIGPDDGNMNLATARVHAPGTIAFTQMPFLVSYGNVSYLFSVNVNGDTIVYNKLGVGVASPAVNLHVDDVIGISNDAEGSTAHMNIRSTRILTAALSGATVNMAFQIPSGAMLLGAQFNVNVAITGATSWSAAFNTGSTTSLGTGLALTLDTKVNKLIVPEITTAATDVTLTAAGSNFTAGVIEGIVYYIDQTNMANA